MKWTRKGKILAASFTAAVFAVTGGFALKGYAKANAYRQLLNNSYQHAFSELATNLGELDTALQKGIYATSPATVSTLCTEIFGKAMAAQMAIGELPYGNVELEQTAAFVAKVGDYAMALSRSAATNGGYSDAERTTLQALSDGASSLSSMLRDLQSELYAGTVELEDLETAQARLSAATEAGDDLAGGSFQTIEADFPEVPSLIYDGPFSEHIASRSPKELEGLPQVDEEQARRTAAAFLDLEPERFYLVSTGEGRLPTYGFSSDRDGDELYVEVTRTGGAVVELMTCHFAADAPISREAAADTALAFLEQRGFQGMTPTYSIQEDNILTLNFAAVQDGVVCYPDLIKVSVALDNGQITGFEAAGYLMNHCRRDLPALAVTEVEAQGQVSPELNVLSHTLALIPTSGEYEVLCHEFKCETADGRHILVYVNARTGLQEKLLLLLEDENGTLTI